MSKLINIFTGNPYETFVPANNELLPVGNGTVYPDYRARHLGTPNNNMELVRKYRAKLAAK